MLAFIKKKERCTGCGACLNICPVDAITLCPDEEGFSYPVADENCIDCRKCQTVCPLFTDRASVMLDIEQCAYAALSKDKHVWQSSASGGAFTEICKAFGDADTVIFGAAFDELKVRHTHVVGWQHNEHLRRSKYVQSDIGTCYREVRDFLENNQRVIFSGTPCQIAGLKSYLGRDYARLLCIDFICHGVGSPGVFKSFLEYLEAKYGSRIISYTFRFKKMFLGNFRLYVSRYVFDNQKTITVEKDEYNRLFLQQLCLRPSCSENCQFRTANRLSDLTMADFKRRDKAFPELTDYRNYSTIVVNSQKGNKVLQRLKENMDIRFCPLEHIRKFNPLFDRTTPGNPLRQAFFRDFAAGANFSELVLNYHARPQKSSKITHFKRMVPYKFRNWVHQIRAKQ